MEIVKENAPNGWEYIIQVRPRGVEDWTPLHRGHATRKYLDLFHISKLREVDGINQAVVNLLEYGDHDDA